VADGETGFVIDDPLDVDAVAARLIELLDDAELRRRMSDESRRRAVEQFEYDVLAARLATALEVTA
jgi:phosphatidyl-myo-inositol dimannoside synthase